MSDSNMILNPKSNRYVKRSSQTGKRLLKELASPPPEVKHEAKLTEPIIPEPILTEPEPIQKALLETGVKLVEKNEKKQNLKGRRNYTPLSSNEFAFVFNADSD